MPSVLLTAFEPYDRWPENASWLVLVELTRELPPSLKIVTRRYPVDFEAARARLEDDLAANYDFAFHLGQAPGISRIHLEAIGVNIGGHSSQAPDEFRPLVVGGPPAYQSDLPLAHWSSQIRALGIPCQVSYHAGTYLCNALLYLTHHIASERRLRTRCTFVHLPLAPQQVLIERQDWPTLPSAVCCRAVQVILDSLNGQMVVA
jgi:pyroglutamyl-peptidase